MFPLVADEDVDAAIVQKLRNRGVEVFFVDEEMKGALDADVLERAEDLNRPVLTFDEEFARAYEDDHVFLYVTRRPSDGAVVDAVCEVVENLDRNQISGMVYISPG
ncbi:MAG: DUF5615 family PIN-like protein [Candidatus Nanohaloarchaea archaeon]|nr:DUF5615 family PIN-like protein [Candidatus Nanohaloarchaea archaeon]